MITTKTRKRSFPISLVETACLCIVMLSSCHSNKGIAQQNTMTEKAFNQQGHRGCRGLMPENTIPAMIYALGFPTQTLELDVVISKDKKVVVSHEAFFNHEISSSPDGHYLSEQEGRMLNLYKMDYAEIRKYDVGLKPHPRFPRQEKMPAYKPLLAELIDSVQYAMMTRRRPMPLYNIEIKSLPGTDNTEHPAPEEFVDLVMQVVKEKQMEDLCIIQSFDIRILQVMQRKYPRIRLAFLIDESDKRPLEEQIGELGFSPVIYSPHFSLATKQRIEECHARNIRIIPWTVNDKATILSLKKNGADGVISDYPDLFE